MTTPSPTPTEAPRDPTASLEVRGIGRVSDEPCALLIFLTERPTDDEIRRVHNCLRARLLRPAQAETDAHRIARCVRGCTTDQQYIELVERIAGALLLDNDNTAALPTSSPLREAVQGLVTEVQEAIDYCAADNCKAAVHLEEALARFAAFGTQEGKL